MSYNNALKSALTARGQTFEEPKHILSPVQEQPGGIP